MIFLRVFLANFGLACCCFQLSASDQPQWGQAWSRNMVSDETRLPATFDRKTGKNIKWSAQLGTETHSTPIIAGGRVYIGTNNGNPRDPKEQGDRGVLMCFDEKTGALLWELVVAKREEDRYFDWPNSGIASPVTVDGGLVYLVNNRGEVMCIDPAKIPPATTKTIPRTISKRGLGVVWLFDLTAEAGIWSHDAAHSSILVYGDYLILNTGTGVDNTHKAIRTPNAPSLLVLDKHSGRLITRDAEHIAPDIFHSTWCSPSLGTVNGKPQIFFAAGNGMLYSFELRRRDTQPPTDYVLQKIFSFDFDPSAPKQNIHSYLSNRREGPSNFYGMPVFYHNRIYLTGGGDLWWGKNEAWLKCIDATKTGDVTTNALIWSYPLQKHVLSTPAIYNGLVFIADCGRMFHCVDAETGKPIWTHDIKGEAWASPMVADGKVYLGTRSGAFYVFAARKEKVLLTELDFGEPISATVTAANRALYVATMSRLYAVKQEDK